MSDDEYEDEFLWIEFVISEEGTGTKGMALKVQEVSMFYILCGV